MPTSGSNRLTERRKIILGKIRSAAQRLAGKLRPKWRARKPAAPERYPWEDNYPDGLDWRAEFDIQPVTAILDTAVALYPDRPCLDFMGKRYDYSAVDELVNRAAHGLRNLGVDKGVRVGLLLPNCPYYVIFYYAILRAGGTVVNFNPLYAAREIKRQIEDSGTKVMVTLNLNTLYPKISARLADTPLETIVVCQMRDVLPFPSKLLFAFVNRKEIAPIDWDGAHVSYDTMIDNDGVFERPPIDPARDVAVLQYTGGTTGTPKGAMLTHANLYANAAQVRAWGQTIQPGEDRFLASLPLFHVFGMTGVMNCCLFIGGELILLPRFNLNEVLKVIAENKPTVFCGVPTMFSAINGHKEVGDHDLSSLRLCISGGAPLPMPIKQKFEELSGCSLVEGYGLTEAGPVCSVNPFMSINKPDSVGLPLPGTLVEITDRDDPERVLPYGEHGEICITGPQVMAGYFNRPEENIETFQGGRLHTGDIGYIDEDGYLYIIDRIKDLILSGGYNVYPRMVEEAIYLHPDVEEAVVGGVPHAHRGEIVKAYVRLRPGASVTARELRTFLKGELAPFEVPSRVEFRDELPRTLIGKPWRQALRAEEERRARETPDTGTEEKAANG